MMNIAVLLYDGITALDAIGPYEVLRQLPDAEIEFLGEKAGQVITDGEVLKLVASRSIAETSTCDILIVPGGPGSRELRDRAGLIEWIRVIHQTTQWTTSVCTGALLLGYAGLLDGIEATTHWAFIDALEEFGAIRTDKRFVRSGKIVTAAGVSAGIDMALWLAGEIAGQDIARRIQLALEYDPQPPFDSGSPGKAHPRTKTAVAERLSRL